MFDLRSQGVESVEWLVHPGNAASIAFSRVAFPEADETNPPDDAPDVSFALSLWIEERPLHSRAECGARKPRVDGMLD